MSRSTAVAVVARIGFVVGVASLTTCSSTTDGTAPTTVPATTTTTTTLTLTPTAAEMADVFFDAALFTASADGRAALFAQEQLVADCMADRGLTYEAVVPPPGDALVGADDYGLVDYFLAAGQDTTNAAVEAALRPGDALEWREALNGPPRSLQEETPVSDDPAVVGCGPSALPRFIGTEHAGAMSELVGRSIDLVQSAEAVPDVADARTRHDLCLVDAGVGVTPADVTDGFDVFPLVRRWFEESFADSPAVLRDRVAAGDSAVTTSLDDLRARERALLDADRRCDAVADAGAVRDAALRTLSVADSAPAAQRRAFVAALGASRRAVDGAS